MDILVTNNPLVQEQYQSNFRVVFFDTDLLGVLIRVRDRIHDGCRLLTHPLSGSIKPNESPYKSVLLEEASKKNDLTPENGTQSKTDFQSVSIIEECIKTAEKFQSKHIPEKYLKDMQIVDLSLIRNSLENKRS